MENNLAFLFPLCWGEAKTRVSKDVFLMFQKHHPVSRVEKEKENIVWKAWRPKLFLNLMEQVQLESQSHSSHVQASSLVK